MILVLVLLWLELLLLLLVPTRPIDNCAIRGNKEAGAGTLAYKAPELYGNFNPDLDEEEEEEEEGGEGQGCEPPQFTQASEVYAMGLILWELQTSKALWGNVRSNTPSHACTQSGCSSYTSLSFAQPPHPHHPHHTPHSCSSSHPLLMRVRVLQTRLLSR